jgi:hypothetical protein
MMKDPGGSMATEHAGPALAARVRALLADAEAALAESEARLAYRREHGRELSQAHKAALASLLPALDALRGRLAALVGPDIEALRREFEELTQRLGLEEHDGDE